MLHRTAPGMASVMPRSLSTEGSDMTNTEKPSRPAQTEQSREWAKALRDAAKAGTFPEALADRFADAPTEQALSHNVTVAQQALDTASAQAATWAAIRFDAVAIAHRTGALGKGRAFTQTTLAKVLGLTQGRVSQILAVVREEDRVATQRKRMADAAKVGKVDDDNLGSVLANIARNGTEEDVTAAVQTLESGKVPGKVERATVLDPKALATLVERVVRMSSLPISSDTDTDAVERAAKALALAAENIRRNIPRKASAAA